MVLLQQWTIADLPAGTGGSGRRARWGFTPYTNPKCPARLAWAVVDRQCEAKPSRKLQRIGKRA